MDAGRVPSYASDEDLPLMEDAGLMRRLGAWFVDLFLYYGGVFAVTLVVPLDGHEPGTGLTLILLLVLWAYFTLFESSFGGTLGKLALGIRVVRPTGRRISFGRAAGRSLARLVPFDAMVGLFSSGNRCIHDRVADTLVVKREEVPEL